MKTTILALLALSTAALGAEHIVVKLTGANGEAIPKADVVAILKSGAYQNTKFVDGAYVCDPAEQCVKVYAAAVGYEAVEKRYSGSAGEFTIAMKPNPTKSSAIIRRSGVLPGIKGSVSPILDSERRTYLYSTQIGLEKAGKPALQPLDFALNQPISAVTGTGQKFKIYVVDITQAVSLLEYTQPK